MCVHVESVHAKRPPLAPSSTLKGTEEEISTMHAFDIELNGIKCPVCGELSFTAYANTLHMAIHNDEENVAKKKKRQQAAKKG